MRVISGKARGVKLNSIDDISTRPTLDRVKESLFNIIHDKIENSIVLDLFSGSGSIGIEFISRGCQKAYLCDMSHEAIKMINQNLEKTRFTENAIIMNMDYKKCLNVIAKQNIKLDTIFIDPPYKANYAIDSVKMILDLNLLSENGIIIIETDEPEREIEGLEKLNVEIYDNRKYGRASLIFLVERG